jgi:hypothetical protein
MISIISLSDGEKRKRLEASDTALSVSAFLAATPRRLLYEAVHEMNYVNASLTVYIDQDGDIAYQITDLSAPGTYRRHQESANDEHHLEGRRL